MIAEPLPIVNASLVREALNAGCTIYIRPYLDAQQLTWRVNIEWHQGVPQDAGWLGSKEAKVTKGARQFHWLGQSTELKEALKDAVEQMRKVASLSAKTKRKVSRPGPLKESPAKQRVIRRSPAKASSTAPSRPVRRRK